MCARLRISACMCMLPTHTCVHAYTRVRVCAHACTPTQVGVRVHARMLERMYLYEHAHLRKPASAPARACYLLVRVHLLVHVCVPVRACVSVHE